MRSFACVRSLSGVLLVALLATAQSTTARTWTNSEGQTLEADFVRYRTGDRTVLLRDEEGKLVPAPYDRLSEEDRAWVETYRDMTAPRLWGEPKKRQRGRFQVLRDEAVEVRLASESLDIPLKELTAEDVAYLESLYKHTEKELPAGFSAIKRAAVASLPPEDAPERDWTDAKGRTLTALYGGTEGDRAILWIKGKRHPYPLTRLSAADRKWIGQQKLGQLASDLQGGWSAAATFTSAGMMKAITEGRTPPAMPPLTPAPMNRGAPSYGDPNADPSQMASGEFDQSQYDRGYQDPATTADDPNAAVNAYQAGEPPVDMPPDGTQPVDPNAAPSADPAASDNGRGPPPWITSIDDLSPNEAEARMREAFGDWVDHDEDIAGDAYCSHCDGEFLYPPSFAAGSPCPFCGMAMAADDLSPWDEDDDDSGSSGRPWYASRFTRRLVIGTVVLVIGVAVQLARSGILSGGGGGGDEDDE